MANPFCHFAHKGGVDERIANIIHSTKEDVVALRELYDIAHPNDYLISSLDEEEFNRTLRNKKEISGEWSDKLIEAANKLSAYKDSQLNRHRSEIMDSTVHMARTFNRLYHVPGWSQNTRRNRINMIATEFTMEVSRRLAKARETGNPVSREQIVNGYKSDGKYYDGQLSIFESIFNKFFNIYVNRKQVLSQLEGLSQEQLNELIKKQPSLKKVIDEAKHIVEEYPKILSNWAGLCTFARMSLRDIESLKLGQTLDYAAPTTPDNFVVDTSEEDAFDLEEQGVREAWMERTSGISAFGSLGSEVRRFLATIADVDENGSPLKDDFGYSIRMDPVETHRYLADLLRGITSESNLIKKLFTLSDSDPKVNAIFKALSKAALMEFASTNEYGDKTLNPISDTEYPGNPVIITQFLEDLHKNMVPYTALIRNKAGDVIAKLLNREVNPLHDEFLLRMTLGNRLVNNAIYDENGNMDWQAFAQWYEESERILPAEMKKAEEKEGKRFSITDLKAYGKNTDMGGEFWNLPYSQKIDFIVRSSKALGINLNAKKDARRILNTPELRSAYIRALREFRTETAGALPFVSDQIKVLAKYSGIRPSVSAGFSAEQVAEYDKALEAVRGLDKFQTYKAFREKAYGKNSKNANKSVGAGDEAINKMLNVIARVRDNIKTERRISWFDRKGKATSRFSDLTPSYMGDLIDKIHEFVNNADKDGLQTFIEDKWGKSSFFVKDLNAGHGKFQFYNKWLQELYDSIEDNGISSDALAKVFQFEEFLGSNIDKKVSIFENFTEKQHAEAMLMHFLQPSYDSNNSTLAKYPCFILGDSGTQRFFTARHYTADAKTGVHTEILQGLKDVFQQELEHQNYVVATNNMMKKFFADKFGYQYVEESGKGKVLDSNGKELSAKALNSLGYRPIENYSQTENEFTTLTFLNHTFKNGKYWKILTGNDSMTDTEVAKLSKEKAMEKATAHVNTDALESAIMAYMEDAVQDFKKKLVSVGVLQEVKKEGEDIKYVDANNLFKTSLDKHYKNNMDALIKDFFWNTKFATIEQLQLFTVDPAFYDHNYPVKDLQKRYKEIYAPGKGVSIEARDYNGRLYATNPYERVVYFDDIKLSSEDINPMFWNMLKETFKDRPDLLNLYKKNTLTDGQGYRTLDSYRAVKGMAGEWTMAMEEAYNRIQAIRKGNSDENRHLSETDIKEIAQLATIFQPIKPYLYTLEKMQLNNSDMALIPVQHKYAEIVLIPELMKDGKLRDLALWMENHQDESGNAPIDMVCSTKCVKVGAFGSVDIKGTNTTEDFYSALDKAYVHNLAWADYRIQTGVPEHLNHAQLFGTQIRKLILANINKDGNFTYDYLAKIVRKASSDPRGLKVNLPGMGKVYLNGRNLISFYNCLIMANMMDSYEELAKQCNTSQNLSDKLIQNVISNTNQSEDNAFGMSIIDDSDDANNGDFVIPPGEPGMEHDSSALLWSLFKKMVNKQKIKGGSAVQASPFGLSRVTGKDLGLSGRAEEAGDLFEMMSPEGDNVLYDEIEMPFNVSYTAATGKNVPLKFEDWCNTDGTLKLCDGKEGRPLRIVKGEAAREYLSWPVSGRDEFGRPNEVDENGYDPNGYFVPLIEDRYPGVLDIIAYRIPTERDYSMINCKVFRFSNPLAGGTMKVPSSRTTTAGFDFDIDKLYFFMRELTQTHLSKAQINEIWKEVYSQNPLYQEFHTLLNNSKKATMSDFGQNLFGALFAEFPNSGQLRDLAKTDSKDKELKDYQFWESVLANDEEGKFASLPKTAEEAFTAYLEKHRDEYPIFSTYNLESSPLDNTRAARNNMLLDLMRQRLMDKETLRARYTPGGFENNRDAALEQRVLQYAPIEEITDRSGNIDWNKVRDYMNRIKDEDDSLKDPEPEYDPSDPTAVLVYNQQNQVAGKLIGIFANQNTNHVYASTLHEMSLMDAIQFGDTERHRNGLGNFLKGPEGVDVDTNVAEYLAASVDAVKDPVLNFLNLNLITADAGAMLARIGYTPREIGLLFNQPIIKEVCDYAANNNVDTDNAILEISKRYGGGNLSKVKFDSSAVTTDKLAGNILSDRRRIDSGSPLTGEFKQGQIQALWLFNEILKDTSDLNSFVQCTRFTAANSVGSTWGDMFAQEERVKQFIDRYQNESPQNTQVIDGVKVNTKDDVARIHFELFDPAQKYSEDIVTPEESERSQTKSILDVSDEVLELPNDRYMARMSRNPLAFEQCMMDLQRKAARKLFGKFYPFFTELYSNMRGLMGRLSKYGVLNADTINSLHREFIVYLLSKQTGSKFDGETMNTTLEDYPMTNRQYFLRQYPVVLQTLKSEGVLEGYPFFEALTVSGDEKENGREGIKITVSGMGGLQKSTSNTITEMWADAYMSDEKVHSVLIGQDFSIKQLAEDFYFYNYYHLGYNFHPTSSMSLAPTVQKLGLSITSNAEENGYIDFIRKVIKGQLGGYDVTSFAKQYILNHLDNRSFVYTPKDKIRNALLGKEDSSKIFNKKTGAWNTTFLLSIDELNHELEGSGNFFLIPDSSLRGDGAVAFVPVIAIERTSPEGKPLIAYYMADSNTGNGMFNHSLDGNKTMRYTLAMEQGSRGHSLQYFTNSAFLEFQRKGRLAEAPIKTFGDMNKAASETQNQASAEKGTGSGVVEGNAADMASDGAPEAPTGVKPLQSSTQHVRDMFTDGEWQWMFNRFKLANEAFFSRDDMRSTTWQQFRDIIANDVASNLDILKDLSSQLAQKKLLYTIDENGKEIEVCPI